MWVLAQERPNPPAYVLSSVYTNTGFALMDGADNNVLIEAASARMAPAGGTLTVTSSESDATPPEVLQISFDKAMVGGGEKDVVRVEARDDRSGVASVEGACQSPSKALLMSNAPPS